MKLELTSNEFNINEAISGGALYIQNKDDIEINENRNIILEHNRFKENYAEYFGGAIYTKFSKLNLIEAKNNEIIFNKAGVMSGGIYTYHYSHKNLFNNNSNFIFRNNTVNLYINNYSSNPSSISLDTIIRKNPINIITSDYLPLSFSIYDEYDNDFTKYYSDITLRVSLKSEKTYINKMKLLGNICLFINGKIN